VECPRCNRTVFHKNHRTEFTILRLKPSTNGVQKIEIAGFNVSVAMIQSAAPIIVPYLFGVVISSHSSSLTVITVKSNRNEIMRENKVTVAMTAKTRLMKAMEFNGQLTNLGHLIRVASDVPELRGIHDFKCHCCV
jgi:hypothetical protein